MPPISRRTTFSGLRTAPSGLPVRWSNAPPTTPNHTRSIVPRHTPGPSLGSSGDFAGNTSLPRPVRPWSGLPQVVGECLFSRLVTASREVVPPGSHRSIVSPSLAQSPWFSPPRVLFPPKTIVSVFFVLSPGSF